MKILTVTNTSTNNYGSVLQAFALQKKLAELGADAYVLRKNGPTKSMLQKLLSYFTTKHYSVKDKLAIRKSRKQYAKKRSKLNEFYANNIQSLVCHSLNEASILAEAADVLLAGSDLIWSSDADMLSEFTTLQFGPAELKRFSYAASVGAEKYDESSEKIIRKGLANFSAVSVRESSTVNLIQGLTCKNVIQNIDPVFLFDSSFWDNVAAKRIIENPYILVYVLRPEPLTLAAARKLSEITGKEIFVISNRIIDGMNNITDAGAEDWLSYIKNADYVLTNSFHGTAFAVVFKKRFLAVAIEGNGIRVSDFLASIGLENRIALSLDDVEKIDEPVDWESVDELLKEQRNSASSYLSTICDSKSKSQQLFSSKSKCCGCAACANVCPKNAITMTEDDDGFMYPETDYEKCVDCGACLRSCYYQNQVAKSELRAAWAGVSTNTEILARSASGGVFASLAMSFLENGGYVAGVELIDSDGGLKPVHSVIHSSDELVRFQSSKYAHSETGFVYREIRELLSNGQNVLFSGTSCQVAGLKGFLGKVYDNLFTVDIICHGVPSVKMLQSYLNFLKEKYHSNVTEINFRDKNQGWGEKGFVTFQSNKKITIDPYHSSFYKLYLMGAAYRLNCYTCPYTNCRKRPGDLTLGDFWGVAKVQPELLSVNGGPWKKDNGISCVLVNSLKGEDLLNRYGSSLELRQTSAEKITVRNKLLTRPTSYFSRRDDVLRLLREKGYRALDRWFWRKYGLLIKARFWWRKLKTVR